ncbi:S8 family serine peptidase [Hymenobacter cavernae]|uniref:T9SS C-terminal target domain-containing protein n=1 Tax=Hymenobacter cavernae TaxID=2044852 RepID=A0ABQ1UU38_9BACT|nr:S8 family serine peptidase [Hymenobacter cavernae]GGF26573.1 hypothetical protein GCM10011383_42620 [Hymenobacter cavernae]
MFTYRLCEVKRQGRLWVVLLVLGSGCWPWGQLLAQQQARTRPGKLAPAVAETALRAAKGSRHTYRVQVQDSTAFQQWVQRSGKHLSYCPLRSAPRTFLVAGLDAANLAELLTFPWLEFVDVPNRAAHEERQLDNSNLGVNKIAPLHSHFPRLTGQGLTVSVKENPFDPKDIDFKGRVLNPEQITGTISAHATAMATLIAGGGNSAPTGKGAAWQARLATSSFAELLPDDGQQLAQAGVSVQNHSYGVGIENYYGLEAQAYDQQSVQYPSLVHVFSSGNEGTSASTSGTYRDLAGVANLTGQFKMSKNTISVGATDALGQVAPLSSRGPAYDGRVKPELVAYGADGTSDASALVSGISLLLQQAYRDQYGTLPPSSLVKAALLTSADDTGRPAVDFVSGYGQADAQGAVQVIQDKHFVNAAVSQNQEQITPLTVPAGTYELKATLVWTDPAADVNAAEALVHDLDLELVHLATGQRWQPWVLSPHPDSLALPAHRRPDHLNNAEQITLTLPAAGAYELRVRGYRVSASSQAFSLAFELGSGFNWVSPTTGTNLRPATSYALRWQWRGPATAGRLEYKAVGNTQWQEITSSVALAQDTFAWRVPETLTRAQVRCVVNGAAFESDTFSITRPLALQVGYACQEEALLYWSPVPGVARYQVYRLGTNYLEPFAQTTDTVIVLNRSQSPALHYAVAPVVRGVPGERGSTIDYTQQGTACYVRSFLPRQLVTDTVQFDLTLGSVYQLKSLTLERLEPTIAQLQTISPVNHLAMVLADPAPQPGRNVYRVRLETSTGRTFYSEPEEVQYIRANELVAFPNPVGPEQPLQLILGEIEAIRVRIYDLLGRLRRETESTGTIHTVDVTGLGSGTYLLRVQAENGLERVVRVVIL